MKRTPGKIILLTFLLIHFATFRAVAATSETDKQALAKKLEHVINLRYLREARLGIGVYSLTRKEMLFEHNLNEPLNPASNQKLVTTWAALKELGPYYQFKTTFYANRSLDKGSINTLYIKGGGDPYMVIERLWRIAG